MSECTSTIVFDAGTSAKLARRLDAIRSGNVTMSIQGENIHSMELFIERFSGFHPSERAQTATIGSSQGHVVVSYPFIPAEFSTCYIQHTHRFLDHYGSHGIPGGPHIGGIDKSI
jgi:hypothetical protein